MWRPSLTFCSRRHGTTCVPTFAHAHFASRLAHVCSVAIDQDSIDDVRHPSGTFNGVIPDCSTLPPPHRKYSNCG
eukprot:3568840-Pleurochrysis_carterae.AAC.2